jgi:hypothetical protein
MEQLIEQRKAQLDEPRSKPRRPVPPQLVGKGFKPGVSGFPSGGGRAFKEAVNAAIEALVEKFVNANGRVPTQDESAQLALLARLERRAKACSINTEDLISATNAARGLRRELNLHLRVKPKRGIRRLDEMPDEINVTVIHEDPPPPPPKPDPAQFDDLFSQFRERHQREPSAGEATQLRTAAELAFKIESGTAKENLGPLAGHLNHTLKSLGLDQRPSSHASRPSAHEYVNQNISDEQTD